jgi:hippurate hydrolase
MSDLVDSQIYDKMVRLRRDLHQHPELSWQENRTSARLQAALDELKVPYRQVADTGILADIPGPHGVPKVALRADMDALPIHEETGLPFASENQGVMHACGHDGHASMLLGAAALLVQNGGPPAPVRLLFQPAEEVGAGALAMIEAGALKDVEMIFGVHLDRHYPTGSLIVTEGPVNAASDRFRIEISGQGGHAARPHESVDAVVVGSLLVTAIQTIVSREINPAQPGVISIGRFQAGTVGNAIAGQAVLEGTIRTMDDIVREHFHEALLRITDSVGHLHGAKIEVTIQTGPPVLFNESDMVALAREAAVRVAGADRVQPMSTANMGGEDFSYYLEPTAGCFIRVGARPPGRRSYPAHSSKFTFDEAAMKWGAAWFYQVVQVAGHALAALSTCTCKLCRGKMDQ